MYGFLVENSIYVVLIIVLIIWSGISFFLVSLDNKVTKLEKRVIDNKLSSNLEKKWKQSI